MSVTVLGRASRRQDVTVLHGEQGNALTVERERAFTVSVLGAGVTVTGRRNRVTVQQRRPLLPEMALGAPFALFDATTLNADDGDRISEWRDWSGNGHHLTQAATGKQPLYVADALNGQPGLRFANSRADALSTAAFAAMPEPATIVAAVITPQSAPAATQYMIEGSSGLARRAFYLTTTRFGVMLGQAAGPDTGVLPTASPFILAGVFNGASSQMRLNGAAMTGTVGSGTAPTKLTVGARYDETASFDGTICAVVVYDRALTEAELQRVERYLARRYDLPTAFEQAYYVDSVAGVDTMNGRLPTTPKKTLSAVVTAYGASTADATVTVTAPEATPLREQVIWKKPGALTISGADGAPWYHYGSERFTTGWSAAGGGVYSRAVTGYVTGCRQVCVPTLTDADGHWLRLTANASTPTTPAAGEFGLSHTGGTGTLYVHLPGGADPNSHTIEAAKQDFCFWARSSALVTIEDARWYAANVAGHRTGGTSLDDDGNTLTRNSEAWYGGAHGCFATATGQWESAVYEDCGAFVSLNDGFNIHGEPGRGAQHAIQRSCVGAYCDDEGWSAHEDTHSDDEDGVYHHNGSGGATHVGTAHGLMDGTEVYENQRTNTSGDTGGITLIEQTVYTLRDVYAHDNPHEGIFAETTATVTQTGTRSGTEHGNGLPDNLGA